jgi:UrcA family protein
MFSTNDFARNAVSAAGAALLAGACLFAAAAPANATPVFASRSVSFADLNLAQPQGRATLDARIKSAAKSVCTVGGNDLKTRLNETRCIKTAIANAARS